jgi:hypothetical protein
MTKERYRHERKALAIALALFIAIFAVMLPGSDYWVDDVALGVIGVCILGCGFQLAATLMNGADEP